MIRFGARAWASVWVGEGGALGPVGTILEVLSVGRGGRSLGQPTKHVRTHTSSSHSTTSPWSPNPYPHCVSTVAPLPVLVCRSGVLHAQCQVSAAWRITAVRQSSRAGMSALRTGPRCVASNEPYPCSEAHRCTRTHLNDQHRRSGRPQFPLSFSDSRAARPLIVATSSSHMGRRREHHA